MTVPNLIPPTARITEEEAVRRAEVLRQTMPRPEPRALDGLYVRQERRDWRHILTEMLES